MNYKIVRESALVVAVIETKEKVNNVDIYFSKSHANLIAGKYRKALIDNVVKQVEK